MILLKTNMGEITIELNHEKAPKTAANFEQYVKEGFYDGVIFHRVIDGFMVQGGGMEPGMKQKQTRDQIENEADNGLKNEVGTLAMARTMDPHSASRSEEHTSELQSRPHLVCRLLLEKKKKKKVITSILNNKHH